MITPFDSQPQTVTFRLLQPVSMILAVEKCPSLLKSTMPKCILVTGFFFFRLSIVEVVIVVVAAAICLLWF